MKSYDIALLGPLSLDINVEPDGESINEIGGAITYSPYSAAITGVSAVALVKSGLSEEEVKAHFHDFSGDLVIIPAKDTTSIRNVYHDVTHETRTSTMIKQTGAFKISDLDDISAKLYHLGGLIYGDFDAGFIRTLAEKGLLAVDAQCLLRHADPEKGSMYFEDWADKHELLPLIDFFKVDAKEAEILTGFTDREKAARQLHAWGAKEVFISYHEEMTVFDGETLYTCPYKPASTEGRTGRGDTVFAAYIAKRLTENISDSLLFSTGLITLKIAKRGPFRGTLADIDAVIREQNMQVKAEKLG